MVAEEEEEEEMVSGRDSNVTVTNLRLERLITENKILSIIRLFAENKNVLMIDLKNSMRKKN